MLTLVFGRFVFEAMVNRSLDLGLIAKETTIFYGHKFVYFTSYIYKLRYYSIYLTSSKYSINSKNLNTIDFKILRSCINIDWKNSQDIVVLGVNTR